MDNLVSKKELLLEKNISYGQLYRWKRKGLIPEDWFINKSTKTGQETFFIKDDIYSRIDTINLLKEKMSLKELKDYFSGKILGSIKISENIVLEDSLISDEIFQIYKKLYKKDFNYNFLDLLYIYIGSDLYRQYELDLEIIFMLIKEIDNSFKTYKNFNFNISIYKKLGILIPIIHQKDSIYFFDGKLVLKDYDINKWSIKVKKLGM